MIKALNAKTGVVLCVAALSGCSTSEDPRLEGIALSGGNAIAHNSALQIINPWPHGVTNTDIATPAHSETLSSAGRNGGLASPDSTTETETPSDLGGGDLT